MSAPVEVMMSETEKVPEQGDARPREQIAYLDQNVYSKLLDADIAPWKDVLRQAGLRFAFSDVHLYEMRNRPADYARLLTELDAVFLRNPSAEHNIHARISCIEPGDAARRFAEHQESSGIWDAFEAMLGPLHHLCGGQRDRDMQDIAHETETTMVEHLLSRLPAEDAQLRDAFRLSFAGRIAQSTDELGKIDPAEDWEKLDALRDHARRGDPMRNMRALEKVHHLLSGLPEEERKAFVELYPEKFAQTRSISTGELVGLSMALFSMGLVRLKGYFGGNQQHSKFASQVRDARHIEEAARCDMFVTFDKDAAELAEATFAYAGLSTKTLVLQRPPPEPHSPQEPPCAPV